MPFGLHSASATSQRALDQVIGPEMMPHAFAYPDDIIVIGRALQEHKRNLKEVFQRLRAANLKVNSDKCKFFRKELQYLGHRVTDQGIGTDPGKVAAIAQLKPPVNVKEQRQYLGVASWYRRIVPDFAMLVQPLNSLLKKQARTFVLQTYASDYGLSAILTQHSEQGDRVISDSSRALNGAEKNYSATEKECLAIVWAGRKLGPYLEGYHFKVIKDHMALKWLNRIESPSGRIGRWALEIQQYDFEISYRNGQLNIVADALSRQPLQITSRRITAREEGRPNEQQECRWTGEMRRKVRQDPQKCPDYLQEAGQLYRHIPHRAGNEDMMSWKLCVPTRMRQRFMSENHDMPTAGHLGCRKTIARVAARYHRPGMHRGIRRYVWNCESCMRYKPNQLQAAGKMLTQVPEEPWATVCADFVGPLPRSRHGNSILLVLVNRFSKWTEIVPMRRAATETLRKAVRERIVARYGVPKVMITENGVQFTSRAFRRFLEELGVGHQLTAPYTPQGNPTERVQQDHENNNRAVHRGRSEDMGRELAGAAAGENAEKLKEIFELVWRNMKKAAQDQARHYNLRRRPWKPKVGETVWTKEHHLSKQPRASRRNWHQGLTGRSK
ncbi:uncharacterized protein LOC122756639 [Drosophila santomea]|uniref:uncharacterized protein LOC122756639 n=1 Tax=Drosophila santomea TaxID=129105 RepID=UPI001CCE2ED5|nr:uncharacterized protein LOC122756639 [Drosophila santomea]